MKSSNWVPRAAGLLALCCFGCASVVTPSTTLDGSVPSDGADAGAPSAPVRWSACRTAGAAISLGEAERGSLIQVTSLAFDGREALVAVSGSRVGAVLAVTRDGGLRSVLRHEVAQGTATVRVAWNPATRTGLAVSAPSTDGVPGRAQWIDAEGNAQPDTRELPADNNYSVAATATGFLLIAAGDARLSYATLESSAPPEGGLTWTDFAPSRGRVAVPFVLDEAGLAHGVLAPTAGSDAGTSGGRLYELLPSGAPDTSEPSASTDAHVFSGQLLSGARIAGASYVLSYDELARVEPRAAVSVRRSAGSPSGTAQGLVGLGDHAAMLGVTSPEAQVVLQGFSLGTAPAPEGAPVRLGRPLGWSGLPTNAVVRTDRGLVVAWTESRDEYVQFVDCDAR